MGMRRFGNQHEANSDDEVRGLRAHYERLCTSTFL